MRVFLLMLCWLTIAHGKKFVLLNPDNPNIEKSASNISDADIRARSIKMAKFRKWLKYDVDCEFITREELEVKVSHGRCPFVPEIEKTTTTTKEPKSLFFKRKRKPIMKTDTSIFSHENKETVVRAVVGNNKMQDINWTPASFPDLELVGGSMVTFLCDEVNRKKSIKKNEELEFVEWFVNGKRITPSWFDWRVSVSSDGKLGIWPIGVDDSGHFECLVNGQLRASVTVKVIPVSNILIKGLLNYLFVCAIFAVATVSMGCLLGNRNQEKKHVEVDRMEEFLSENVFKTDQMAKERVAAIIEKQGVVDERQLIENKAKSNRSTIMILLQKPMIDNSKKKKGPDNTSKNPDLTASSNSGTSEGTSTTVTEGTIVPSSLGTNETTNETGKTTTETIKTNETETVKNETEIGKTVTKTEEEDDGNDGKKKKENEEDDSDDSDKDDEVASGTTSKGSSTGTSKPSKGGKKGGKKTGKTKGKGKGKTKKSENTGKAKKQSKGSKAKGGAKKAKNTKKKTASKPSKPVKKNK